MNSATADAALEKSRAHFPLWKQAARPLVEAARTVGFFAAIWRGEYKPARHAIKMKMLRSWIAEPEEITFVETGTYMADTVLALHGVFDRVISIEIDPALHEIAKTRTVGAHNVELILGDCVVELPLILSKLETRAAFWLDGHWSGGVTGRGVLDDPIMISLQQIAKHVRKDHFLFIDDARTFQGGDEAPDLIEVLVAIRSINAGYKILVHNDIIVAIPPTDK